ncbi:hypothetical protein PHMEG_00030448 [Phytophthora megakarya]|uniref:Uncharacterized protein n=1 Tax=Phytophthora megakarya TaxID=4795 RepID=A0A225V2U5_9STRA|nr:hypothetical protein PHMEG_00030448 [Phytophthora megakarya]
MEIEHRIVNAKEALDGAGSFVRSAICTSRLRSGVTRVRDSGLVVGYKWDQEIQIGRLDVNVGGTNEAIEYAPDCTQDVAVEVYALQPCTSLVMAQEMMQQHQWVYNVFNGVDQTAIHDTRKIPSNIGANFATRLRRFDITRLSIRHILDYVFYKEGGRPSPAVVVFGDVAERSSGDTTSTPRRRHFGFSTAKSILRDGLSDSEDGENSSDEDVRTREP